jgi:serine/threonine protein kinase
MPFTKQPHAEPIPGYRLLTPLGNGGFGEVWKCEAPGGLFKAIKFVYGNLNNVECQGTQAHEEFQAIQRVKDIRHPFLLSIDRVESTGGELMIVTELADKNLHEVLRDHQRAGRPGIPRDELFRYLSEAAEVLDLMNTVHGLQHLDVKPRNFFVVSNHVKVADFGLVTSMSCGGPGVKMGAVTPLYAAPEVFAGRVSPASDQYGLAVCLVELLTGRLPFDGRNSRQLLLQHLQAEPDLSALDPADRTVLARALAKDPALRYPSCLAFLQALPGGPAAVSAAAAPDHAAAVPVAWTEMPTPLPGQEALTRTPNVRAGETATVRTCRTQSAAPAGLAGYQFVERQGSSLLADVWKVVAPDGRLRQVRFVFGLNSRGLQEAARRFETLQHPALPVVEVVQTEPGQLVLVNDLPGETLRERWQKCQAHKLSGIPRGELLGYLRTVAEALDYLYEQHAITHLGLNPRNLQFVDGCLQMTEFGLTHLFWVPAGQPVAQRNARYAPPELFEQQVHRGSDQYSLALLYHELLTGTHAFAGMHRSAANRTRAKPDLGRLPEGDRAAVARALAADPHERWPSCCELIRHLEGTTEPAAVPAGGDALTEIIVAPHAAPVPQEAVVGAEALAQILNDLLGQAGADALAADAGNPPVLSPVGDELTHRFRAGLPVGAARLKVDAFRQQADGKVLREAEEEYAFHVRTPANLWQQWTGRPPGLDVAVQFSRPHALSATPIDVAITIRAVRCGKRAAQLVQDLGGNLLEGLRAFLLVNSEKRTQDRLLWPHPVQVCGVDEDGTVGPAVACRGKDISLGGIGFYLPHELPTAQVLVYLPASGQERPLGVPATLVRAKRCADGWYDVGALFRLAALRRSRSEISLAGAKR